MENLISAVCPPHFDENNYSYWKVKVKAYIKAINEKFWRAILTDWSPPIVVIDDTTTVTLKYEKTWTKEENTIANSNFKALNAILSTVDVT